MDKLPIAFHPAARAESLEAFEHYYERSPTIARAFMVAIENAGFAVQNSPNTWATYLYGTRRYLLSRFPYVFVYRLRGDRIEVVAVAHGHRKPGYWIDRIS